MANASSYPVTFKFGATSSPYSPTNPHTGSDHAMPANTPIDVGNTIVGYAGTTGKSTGNHCHVQKYKGGYLDPGSNGFGNSIPFPARVSEVGYRDDIGNFVRLIDATGTRWSYFHMVRPASVSVGHIINAYVVPAPTPAPQKGDKKMNEAEENDAYRIVLERPRDGAPSGRTGIDFMRDAQTELSQRRAAANAQAVAKDNQIGALNGTIADLQNQITAIKSQADELAQRPSRDALDVLQKQLDEALLKCQPQEPEPTEPSTEKFGLLAKLFSVFLRKRTK